MLQIPKAVVQIPEQDPQGMGSIYFSLENQISLVQASQRPDNTIKMHWKECFCSVIKSMNKAHTDINENTIGEELNIHSFARWMRINHLSFPKNKKKTREQRGMHIALEEKKKKTKSRLIQNFKHSIHLKNNKKLTPPHPHLLKVIKQLLLRQFSQNKLFEYSKSRKWNF